MGFLSAIEPNKASSLGIGIVFEYSLQLNGYELRRGGCNGHAGW